MVKIETRVRVRMSALGLSATELCRRTPLMTAANFYRAIAGPNPNLSTLETVAGILGMPSAWLLKREGWADDACDLEAYPAPIGETT